MLTLSCGLSGDSGRLSAAFAAAEVDGRRYGVVAIAVAGAAAGGDGEAPAAGDGASALAGAQLYWGCAEQAGRGWRPPPQGWHTDPDVSYPAGGAA